jgi:hypothetical protein
MRWARLRVAWCAAVGAALSAQAGRGGGVLTVLTGTHAPDAAEGLEPTRQSAACQNVNALLRAAWTAFSNAETYLKARVRLEGALARLGADERCLFGASAQGELYTFPLSLRSSARCSAALGAVLESRGFVLGQQSVEALSRVTVPWLLLRPDLVMLERAAARTGVALRLLVSVGHESDSAAFAREGCPRMATLLRGHEVFRQRVLQAALGDLSFQLGQLAGHAQVVLNVCSVTERALAVRDLVPASAALGPAVRVLQKGRGRDAWATAAVECPAPGAGAGAPAQAHSAAMLAAPVLGGHAVAKTVFARDGDGRPVVVFVAGLEGTGHHLFSTLGKRHTTRALYDALTNYMSPNATGAALGATAVYDDFGRDEQFLRARAELVAELRALHGKTVPADGSRVFFLNTVIADRPVNMYSYTWGGPRCYLKKHARTACSVDLADIAQACEEAGVDLRVVVLQRNLGAATVSASKRDFGTVMSQTRVLAIMRGLLHASLGSLDPAFYDTFEYDQLIRQPHQSAARLAKLLALPPDAPLARWFDKTLTESNTQFGARSPTLWMDKLSRAQFEFIADSFYLAQDLRAEFDAKLRQRERGAAQPAQGAAQGPATA